MALRTDNNPTTILKNNVFVNARTNTSTNKQYAVLFDNAGTTCDNNYLENGGINLANWAGSNRNTLADWIAISGATNSESDPVGTISIDMEGYVTNDPNFKVADAGENLLAIIPDDKDNVARDVNPWRGAYEAFQPLPVEFIKFEASLNNHNQAELEWISASELNNDYYIIERSSNGVDWQDLFEVEGAGTTQKKSQYAALDAEPLRGLSYYRLSQVDYDGTTVELGISVIQMEGDSPRVYPNPVRDILTIELDEEYLEIQIMDSQGRVIRKITPQTNVININCREFSTGVYRLSFYSRNKSFAHTFTVY